MKEKLFWLNTLNVRPDESWLVKKVFFLQFLQGSGLAFFFTASFALFLDRFEITELPYVFIYSSLLLWITGFAYSRLEQKFRIGKLAMFVTIFMAISILLFRLAFEYIKTDWFLYWMLAWFNVLYLLNNLEFWGLASLLFNARQSKRLFAVISAGDIPAKFIGYSLALLVVEYIGTINLLWAGLLCMLGSIPLLLKISRSDQLTDHSKQPRPSQKIGTMVEKFYGNVLTRRLAAVTIIVTSCFIIINFSFYAGVKESYQTDVGLAKFIAFFLALVRILALVIKMIVTSRLINKLGIINSLLVTPVIMILLVAMVLVEQNISGGQKVLLYFFGVTALSVDILRSAVNSPVFLTIMQPLSIHERMRAHTIVKGIMDPFATLLTGILLLLLIDYQERVDLVTLSYILLIGGFLWIIGIYRVNSQYRKTLIKTISSRYFNHMNFQVSDIDTLEWLKTKMSNGSELEAVNILSIVRNNKSEPAVQIITMALSHPSEKVKGMALKLALENKIDVPAENLLPLLDEQLKPTLIADCLKALSRDGIDSDLFQKYIFDQDKEIRQAALKGILLYGDDPAKGKVNELLLGMIASTNVEERLMAVQVLGEPGNENCRKLISELMDDNNSEVRKASFYAAANSGDPYLINQLPGKISADEKNILNALFMAGSTSLDAVSSAIAAPGTHAQHKEKLILLSGRIGGDKAHIILINLLITGSANVKAVIKALYRSHYLAGRDEKTMFENIAKQLLAQCAGIVYMQNSLQPGKAKYGMLINSFQLELTALRESLLCLFGIIYNRDDINKVRVAYMAGKKETILNAMEIIDITVRKDLASYFNIIYEPGNVAHRVHELKKLYPVEFFDSVETVLTRILEDEKNMYHSWTMACSLYTSKKQNHQIDQTLIRKYTSSDNSLLSETARFAL